MRAYSGYGGQLEGILREFVQHLKATFGGVLEYVGTTTDLSGPPNVAIRDLDVVVVLAELNEGHIGYVWTIINRLRAKHNLLLDTRIHSRQTLTDIPVINRHLLKLFLVDQFGQNPFLEVSETAESLRPECLKRISEQESYIVRLLPRVAG